MNGVEILDSTTMYNTFLPEACLPIGFISAVILIVAAALCFADSFDLAGWICLILGIISIVVACLSATSNKNDVDYIEYKVTIDDSVLMNEFMDKYEILNQEGKIYTIREKE